MHSARPKNINSLGCLSDHSQHSFRLSPSHRPCARVFTPSLSMNSRSMVAFIRSPRQLLQSNTGVPHFALDPLTYRCLLSLSPAADFAEPRPPRHTHIRVWLFWQSQQCTIFSNQGNPLASSPREQCWAFPT